MALSADRPIRAEDVEAADEWYEEQVELAESPAGVLPTPQNSLPGAGSHFGGKRFGSILKHPGGK